LRCCLARSGGDGGAWSRSTECYRDNADYSERVKAAATTLERDHYLLPQDTKRIVERAAKLTW
jgi:hypothetical protein